EHMEWLKNKLRHSNDLTLRKRLQELLTTYSFLELDETGTFIDDVINTRNYLTHYDKELKTLAVIPEKISTLSMKLRLLTEAILLTELGLSPDTVKFIMKQIKEHRSQIRSYDF
ncbi:MAG: HEPN domain-containing protein, partial [Candidatus Bathyarchaeia archaeon]